MIFQAGTWGIGSIYSSSPVIYNNPGNPPYRNNRIRNCNIGVDIYNNSFPSLGSPAVTYSGYNDIYSNTNYNVSYTSGGSLSAAHCYWGNGAAPASTTLYCNSGSSIYTDFFLTTDPWAGLAKTVNNYSTSVQSAPGDSIPIVRDGSIYEGISLRMNNKCTEAKNFFLKYIASHPEEQAPYVELYNCYNSETSNELINYFSNLPAKAAKEQKLLLSSLYLKQGNIEMAKSINNTVSDENPESKIGVNAMMNNIYIAMYYENNLGEAVSLFNEIVRNPKLSTYLELSLSHEAIESYADMNGLEKINLASVPEFPDDAEYNMGVKAEEIPGKYELFGSYPNPFNPVTTIKYALPQNSQVVLEVYNILGEKITTLVNAIEVPGNHEAVFNGSNLASGIYIYRITAASLETGERFVKSAKMMMLK